jgi:hypothetical protein
MAAMARDVELARYSRLVEEALRASVPTVFAPCDSPGTLRVERGVVYPLLMSGAAVTAGWMDDEVGDLLQLGRGWLATGVRVEDLEGHRRPVYEGLLFYSAFRAFGLSAGWETEDTAVWAEALEARLARTIWPEDGSGVARAVDGARWVEAVWWALASHAAGEVLGVKTDLARSAFGRLAARQRPSGTFLEAGARDNPETHWSHELLLLHAAASYAAGSGNGAVGAAVARAAEYHLNETQPDHATNQPWALAAFARHAQTRPVADGMLHAAATIGRRSGVTSILLADALYCLRLWMA